MPALTITATKSAVALPPLNAVKFSLPPQSLYGAIIAGLALFLAALLIIYFTKSASKAPKKPKAKPLSGEDLQIKHLKDLKDALVKELRGTSKQNTIMIVLTVLFIAVTVFGGGFVMVVFKKAPLLAGQVLGFLKGLIGR
jgi:hypothetical protein